MPDELIAQLTAVRDQAGTGALELGRLPRRLTDATDRVVATLGSGLDDVALVAVGGYGRREQCVASDIDLLILYRGPAPEVRQVLYPLWDGGCKVGHAVRTVRESAAAIRERVETLTAAMDARLIGGDPYLFEGFQREVRGVVSATGNSLRAALVAEEVAARRAEPYHSLAPDLKKSRGFLRTLHRIHWERRRRALAGSEATPETSQEREARTALLAVRNALHLTTGRDRLDPEVRDAVARRLGVDVRGLLELLSHAAGVAEAHSQAVFGADFERSSDPVADAGRRLWSALRRRTMADDGSGVLARAVSALGAPGLAALETVGDAGKAEWTPGDLDRMYQIVTGGESGRQVWEALWRSGWLPRELPEWKPVVGAPQLAPIHAHPVDGHLFRTVDEVLQLAEGSDLGRREAIDELGGPELAVWSALFHDIGKGRPGDHSVVGAALVDSITSRWRLPGGSLLSRAVRHHLLLPEVATKRDIDDPGVLRSVAETVVDPQLLRTLYVLAAADGLATGTGSWTPWRAQLVDRLYRRVMEMLSTERSGGSDVDGGARAVAERLGVDSTLLSDHANKMGPGYLLRHPDDVVGVHLDLSSSRLPPGEVRTALIEAGGLAMAVVVSRDVPGLAAGVAGACADAGISILQGRFEKRADGVAIDTFVVADARGGPVGPARFETALGSLGTTVRTRGALEGVDVQVLGDGRIVEVRGRDRPGFLADVCAVLTAAGHDITLAKLNTRAGHVSDVFYVHPPVTAPAELARQLSSGAS